MWIKATVTPFSVLITAVNRSTFTFRCEDPLFLITSQFRPDRKAGLDSGLDSGLDFGLDSGLDFGLTFIDLK